MCLEVDLYLQGLLLCANILTKHYDIKKLLSLWEIDDILSTCFILPYYPERRNKNHLRRKVDLLMKSNGRTYGKAIKAKPKKNISHAHSSQDVDNITMESEFCVMKCRLLTKT